MAFQGSLKELPLPDIIQLVSVSGKTGVFTLSNESERGEIYLQDGQIVHALVGDLKGEEAIYELAIWVGGDFLFTPGKEAPEMTVKKSNTNLLMEAARRIDEWGVLSKKIPSTRLVPVFTHESSSTSVSFTPLEWTIVRIIDERRNIEEISAAISRSPFETCKVLYGLITSKLIELSEDISSISNDRLRQMTEHDLSALANKLYTSASTLIAGHDVGQELETTFRLGNAELASGRGVDAILDLIRSLDRIVSATLGPNQAGTFLKRAKETIQDA